MTTFGKRQYRVSPGAEILCSPRSAFRFSKPQFLHQPPNVIVVVVDSESGLDDSSEPRRGPAVVGESVEDRALSIDIGNELQLLAAEPAWPPRRAAFPQRIHSPLL